MKTKKIKEPTLSATEYETATTCLVLVKLLAKELGFEEMNKVTWNQVGEKFQSVISKLVPNENT